MSLPISCLHCCYHFRSSQEVEGLVGDAPTFGVEEEEDVAAILEKVRRLDDLIHQLKQDRARLFRRVNNAQAATRHIPPEVLSTIFQFARPPIDFDTHSTPSKPSQDCRPRRDTRKRDNFQLDLGAVSHHWRQVAWTTSQLWTTVSVEICESSSENSASLLNLYFENSRSHSMTVELGFRVRPSLVPIPVGSRVPGEFTMPLESVKTLFLNHAAKIGNLIVTGLPAEWTPLICKNLLRCESLALYWPSSSSYIRRWQNISGSLNLTELPNLRHFRVTDPYVPFTLPWSTITTLHLSGVPVSQGVESLWRCSNLIRFESEGLRPENSSPSLNQPITLEHLESLTWCAYDGAWTSTLLRHIRFSKLRVLNWRIRPYSGTFSGGFHNELATFFSSLPETLGVLELHYTGGNHQTMKTIFASVPQVTELVLSSGFSHSMVMNMIGGPVTGSNEDALEGRVVVDPHHLGGTKVFPHLRKFTLLNNFSDWRPGDAVVIVQMLETLHGARIVPERFCLEVVKAPTNDIWSPEVLARLKRLAESGFEFEILLGSCRLDSCRALSTSILG